MHRVTFRPCRWITKAGSTPSPALTIRRRISSSAKLPCLPSTSRAMNPQPRLKPVNGVVMVSLYTDLKLHDICKGPEDPNVEPLNGNQKAGSPEFFAGNSKFITRRLWAIGSKPNYFHHGQFTTIREAILNHFGEALYTQKTFSSMTAYQQGSIIEFLKTLKAPMDIN